MTRESRSWVNAVTNAAFLNGFDTAQYLAWLKTRALEVNDILPQFLHEGTHHWCFDSRVGNAIALLTLRARRNSYVYGVRTHYEEIQWDVVRALTADWMLQPFSEGLALFAEFDATPGRGKAISQTMMSCAMCFGFPLGDPPDSLLALEALLQTTRRRAEAVRRKAGIYAHTFECEEGYLSGYLAVKALWAARVGDVRAFNDVDIFFGFLRSYIYEDPSLVLTILDEGQNEVRVCERIANYVSQRFQSFLESKDLAKRVAKWEDACIKGESVVPAISDNPQHEGQADQKLVALLSDIDNEGPISEFAVHAFMTTQERKFLMLGALDAVGSVQSGVLRIQCPQSLAIAYETETTLPNGLHKGRLLVVASSNSRWVVVMFVSDHQCQHVYSFGRWAPEEMELLERYVINEPLSRSVHEEIESALERVLADSALQIVYQHLRSNCLRAAESLYGTLATYLTPCSAVPRVLAHLQAGGLLDLLDGDTELARAVALLGLANTTGTDAASLSIFGAMAGIDEALLKRALESAAEREGMPLLAKLPNNCVRALV